MQVIQLFQQVPVFLHLQKRQQKKTFLDIIFVTPSIRDHLPRLEKQHRVKDVGSTNADNHSKKTRKKKRGA